jgi:hypothetical protein
MQTVEIRRRKLPLIMLSAVWLLGAAGLALLLARDLAAPTPAGRPDAFDRVKWGLGAAACTAFGGAYLARVVTDRPAVTLDGEGVTFLSHRYDNRGSFAWRDIAGFATMRGPYGSRFLTVDLADPLRYDDYRALMKVPSYWIGHTKEDVRLALNVSGLQLSLEELKALLNDRLAAYRNQTDRQEG